MTFNIIKYVLPSMDLYVAINRLMPGYCKVGVSNDVSSRMKDLYGPWEAVRTWDDQTYECESIIKNRMRRFAVSGYELFNCPVNVLVEEIEKILSLPVVQKIQAIGDQANPASPEENIYLATSTLHVGEIIRRARTKQDVTQNTVAGLSNVGLRFLSELERGKETIELGRTIRVLSELGLSLFIKSRTSLHQEEEEEDPFF